MHGFKEITNLHHLRQERQGKVNGGGEEEEEVREEDGCLIVQTNIWFHLQMLALRGLQTNVGCKFFYSMSMTNARHAQSKMYKRLNSPRGVSMGWGTWRRNVS
jgi:hypothetical protein